MLNAEKYEKPKIYRTWAKVVSESIVDPMVMNVNLGPRMKWYANKKILKKNRKIANENGYLRRIRYKKKKGGLPKFREKEIRESPKKELARCLPEFQEKEIRESPKKELARCLPEFLGEKSEKVRSWNWQ